MAKIGIKGLTYATVSTGGSESAITYASGKKKEDLLVRANVTIDREDISLYADNHKIEHANGVTGGTVELEVARMPADIKTDLLGYATDGGLVLTEADAPYVGFGYITQEITDGAASYVGHWYYKAQFSMNSDSDETKGETTAFGTNTITANLMGVSLTTGAAIRYLIETTGTTEAGIRTWLNSQAGVT